MTRSRNYFRAMKDLMLERAGHCCESLYAQLHGMEIAEVVRSLLLPFLAEQVHKATVLAAEAQREGIAQKHHEGHSPHCGWCGREP